MLLTQFFLNIFQHPRVSLASCLYDQFFILNSLPKFGCFFRDTIFFGALRFSFEKLLNWCITMDLWQDAQSWMHKCCSSSVQEDKSFVFWESQVLPRVWCLAKRLSSLVASRLCCLSSLLRVGFRWHVTGTCQGLPQSVETTHYTSVSGEDTLDTHTLRHTSGHHAILACRGGEAYGGPSDAGLRWGPGD